MSPDATAFTVEPGQFGSRLVLRCKWHPRVGEYIRQYEIKELYLNYALGFKGKDITFLQDLSDLEWLKIVHYTIEDISPIHKLPKLRVLEIGTYCKTVVDFSRFPSLEECYLEWRPGAKSLFECQKLKRLFLNRYTAKSAREIAGLRSLRVLSIANSPLETVEDLGGLNQVTFLGLYNLRRLRSLRGIEGLARLEELEVNGCWSLHSIEEVEQFHRLRKLQLCDNRVIESLRPIRALSQLESVLFYGSTNVKDGDLSPLVGLKHLRHISFQDRPHYTHRMTELQKVVTVPGSEKQVKSAG
jgi:internalin A